MVLAPINHVCLDIRGVAYIANTRTKVAFIAMDTLTWGMSPEQIQQNYPHLSLGQIHAALAYYFDHKVEVDRQIAEWDHEYEQLLMKQPNPINRQEFEIRMSKGDRTIGI